MKNRRQFTRILFSIDAHLHVDEYHFKVKIHYLSLNGALVSAPKQPECFKNKLGTLSFSLAGTESNVTKQISVLHVEQDVIGLQCNAIDIESVSHLRRLVELNLGDQAQLNKELSQLSRVD